MKKIDVTIILVSTLILPIAISHVILLRLDAIGYLIECKIWVEIVKTLLGIWGTLLGFIVTALSIILAIGNSPFLELLNKSGHMKTIMFSYAITSLILFGATSFGILVMCFNTFNRILLKIVIFLIFSTMLSLIISLFFLFSIIFNSKVPE
ncbi:MAG: hypothetical protein ACLUN9_06550 [Enterocloster aldenensis]|uniref:hypothetical protein n=1 Tax=Enterocloster aldenensis TaxID=358742 RepID=UPI000E40F9DF|nr:hypothetical protein DWX59_23560 [Enterocloster aldenensis]